MFILCFLPKQIDITSDNWFENVLRIYKHRRLIEIENITAAVGGGEGQTWAFPTISKAFYEPLSHKIGELIHSLSPSSVCGELIDLIDPSAKPWRVSMTRSVWHEQL